MLSCIDTVTWAHEHGLTVIDDDPHTEATVRVYTREDFTPVNRFESEWVILLDYHTYKGILDITSLFHNPLSISF